MGRDECRSWSEDVPRSSLVYSARILRSEEAISRLHGTADRGRALSTGYHSAPHQSLVTSGGTAVLGGANSRAYRPPAGRASAGKSGTSLSSLIQAMVLASPSRWKTRG